MLLKYTSDNQQGHKQRNRDVMISLGTADDEGEKQSAEKLCKNLSRVRKLLLSQCCFFAHLLKISFTYNYYFFIILLYY